MLIAHSPQNFAKAKKHRHWFEINNRNSKNIFLNWKKGITAFKHSARISTFFLEADSNIWKTPTRSTVEIWSPTRYSSNKLRLLVSWLKNSTSSKALDGIANGFFEI
jgi:hypothetical protein